MNARNLVRSLLLAVVVGSVAVFAWKRSRSGATGTAPATTATAGVATSAGTAQIDPTAAADVLVTYFTTDVRCDSCRTIEELTRRAVAEGFPTELATGRVVFRVVNTDRPEHQHFVDQYTITNKTVVVSHQRDGREVEWTGRQDVWLHLDEPETFFTYVREPIRGYLAVK